MDSSLRVLFSVACLSNLLIFPRGVLHARLCFLFLEHGLAFECNGCVFCVAIVIILLLPGFSGGVGCRLLAWLGRRWFCIRSGS